jgi:hypothetical protein
MKSLIHFHTIFAFVTILASCSTPKLNYQVSVTFGKAYAYSPHSNEILDWSGNVKVEGGKLDSIFKLTYGITDWAKGYGGCSREYSRRLDKPEWATDIKPGSGRGLEGVRFFVQGDPASVISIETKAGLAKFKLGDLLDKEYLEFPVGGYYSFQPISVFLGPDARPRMSKKAYARILASENRNGTMLIPDDFSGPKSNFMSAWCASIGPKKSTKAEFLTENFNAGLIREVPVKIQLMAAMPQKPDGEFETTSGWMELEVTIGDYSQKIRHFLTYFRQAEKLFDINIKVPSTAFNPKKNSIRISNGDDAKTLMIHRVYINEPQASHGENNLRLPPLPSVPNFWVGYDLNTMTTQNGEVDTLINRMAAQQMGNYVLFRIEETNTVSLDDFSRWGRMIQQNNFKAGTTMGGDVSGILSTTIGSNFLGIHQHESSNLIYGWGDSEPKASRINRTLPDCEAAYTTRMKTIKMLGQALPMCNLDYKSGVGFISSEFPTGHSTLMMASNRGGSYLYNKPFWGVHLANHVMRMPDDESTLRRNFLFLWQSWLYGARLIYDEESALYGIHSTSYSYSDPMSFTRRKQTQELYHYGSAIQLGNEEVKTAYLLGKYDCLVGGVQSSPEMEPTKVWGMFGPETDSWNFDTPERGWELLNIFMPGVWLYPVKQDNSKIRMFLSASPNGQTDLVTIDGDIEKLKKYKLLILPGWNTMTDENYQKLIEYVGNGGHLVIAATQCTNHVTRDFLLDKKDFNFYNQGDLSGLCGLKVGSLIAPVQSIKWKNGKTCTAKGLPGLEAEVMPGASVLAESETGKPVLVENFIGAGKVWTLVAGEYWGTEALDNFRKQLGDTLVALHKDSICLSGDSFEVDSHIYNLPNSQKRIVLLNTDWTIAGNTKNLVVHVPGFNLPVSVREGTLENILMDKNIVLNFTLPGSGARIITSNDSQISLSLSGTGKQEFKLLTGKSIKLSNVDSRVQLNKNILAIDFGEHWEEKIIEIRFVE